MTDQPARPEVTCPGCGAEDQWELRFGGTRPPRIICTACKRRFTLGGQEVTDD